MRRGTIHEGNTKGVFGYFLSAAILVGGAVYAANTTTLYNVIADGKTIYVSPEMAKTSRPVGIDIDITGYNDFKMQFCGEKIL